MHAMRPQLRTKRSIKSPPESRDWIPQPEEAGGGSGACAIPVLPPIPVDAMKNGKEQKQRGGKKKRQRRAGEQTTLRPEGRNTGRLVCSECPH